MSLIRYMLANWRIAYVPKIGVSYRYASEGPFKLGKVLTPRQIKQGHVLYEIAYRDGMTVECACETGVFASMCQEN